MSLIELHGKCSKTNDCAGWLEAGIKRLSDNLTNETLAQESFPAKTTRWLMARCVQCRDGSQSHIPRFLRTFEPEGVSRNETLSDADVGRTWPRTRGAERVRDPGDFRSAVDDDEFDRGPALRQLHPRWPVHSLQCQPGQHPLSGRFR